MLTFLRQLKQSITMAAEHRRKSDELLWAQIFNNTISGSPWFKNQAISPGRWAVGYPALYLLYRIYNEIRPKQILELGLGESTKLLYQYAMVYPCDYTVVEHDAAWIDFFLQDKPMVLQHLFKTKLIEQQYHNQNTNGYEGLAKQVANKKFDCIVIDGPFGTANFSRNQVLELVENDNIAPSFIFIMDDYHRPGEKQTIAVLKQKLKEKKIDFVEGVYSGEKETIIICSPSYRFLCSL